MLLCIPNVLSTEQVAQARQRLANATWIDGSSTAGHIAARVKNNAQLDPANPDAREIGDMILQALSQNSLFLSAALPLRILPPMFNRYGPGQTYGFHIDGSIRNIPGTPMRIRTDLSCTLFFSEPEEYDGGELQIDDTYGRQSVKLPAGHMVLYPSTSLHQVTPVTRGTRTSAFFWLQSIIREDTRRALLYNLDTALQSLIADHPHHHSIPALTGTNHNLLRHWAEM